MDARENPYATPQAASPVGYDGEAASRIPDELAEQLARSRLWVIFLAIASLVFGGLLTLAMVAALVFNRGRLSPQAVIGGLVVMGFALGAMLGGLVLFAYAKRITRYVRRGTISNLEKLLAAQCRVWQVPALTVALPIGVLLIFLLTIFVSLRL